MDARYSQSCKYRNEVGHKGELLATHLPLEIFTAMVSMLVVIIAYRQISGSISCQCHYFRFYASGGQ